MTSKPSVPCCVCGKETSQRCAGCGKAGLSLYFCSKEHQKLVWFAHKEVCGLRSKPFQFPPLSMDEVEDAKRNLCFVYRTQQGVDTMLAGELVKLCDGWDPSLLNKHSPISLFENLRSESAASSDFTLDQRNQLLCQVRTLFYTLPCKQLSSTIKSHAPTPLPGSFPLDFFRPTVISAKFANELAHLLESNSLPPFPSSAEWYTALQHKVLVLTALEHLRYSEKLHHRSASPNTPTPRFVELLKHVQAVAGQLYGLAGEMKAKGLPEGEAVFTVLQRIKTGDDSYIKRESGV